MALKRDFLRTLFTACVKVLMVFLTQVMLARALGPDGRGSFAVCFTLMNFMVMLFSFGGDASPSYNLASSKRTVCEILGTSFYISASGVILAGLLGFALVRSGLPFFKKATAGEFALAICAVGPMLFYIFVVAILRGTFRYIAMNCMIALDTIVIVLSTYFLCFTLNLGVKGALLAVICGATTTSLTTIVLIRKEIRIVQALKSLRLVPSVLHYGIRAYFSYFAQTMNIQLGVVVLGFMIEEKGMIGFYHIAMSTVARIWIIPDSLYQVLMPKLAKDQSASANYLCDIIRIVIIVTMLASLALALAAHVLVKYGLGVEFLPAVPAIYVLLIGVIFRSASKVVTTYLFATNRPGINSVTKLSGVGINLFLLLIFVPLYGMMGAAIATSTSYVLEAVIMLFLFAKISKLESLALLVPRVSDLLTIRNLILSTIPNRLLERKK